MDPQSRHQHVLSIGMALFVATIVGVFAYYSGFAQGALHPLVTPTPTPSSTAKVSKAVTTVTPTAAATTDTSTKASDLTSVDATWNKYTNYKLGFSIKIPKKMIASASCDKKDENGQSSYRTADGLVPVKTFEDGEMVYIKNETYWELLGKTESNNISYFSDCKKQTTTLTSAKDKNNINVIGYDIVVKTVGTDQELEQFLKSEYGKGCSLGAKTVSKQAGTFDVAIKGDGKDLGDTECPVNYITKIKYNPTLKKLAKWDVGQDFRFGGSGGVTYDDDINNSFQFN